MIFIIYNIFNILPHKILNIRILYIIILLKFHYSKNNTNNKYLIYNALRYYVHNLRELFLLITLHFISFPSSAKLPLGK